MFRRRSTTSDSTDASAYSRRSAIADSVWSAQDRARSGFASAFRAAGGGFERIAFPLQERVAWPLADRAGTMGGPARALSFALVVLLAAAAGVGGLVWAAPDKGQNAAATTAVAAPAAAPIANAKEASEQVPEPTLQGAAPVFKPAGGQAASEVDPAKPTAKSSPPGSAAAEQVPASSSTATSSSSAAKPEAQASAVDGPPAGPAAVSVAREFSGAFVVYETGGSDAAVRRTFGETATPQLAKALLRRPPRLPANVEVPKAKVVNVVAGPSHDDVFSVSVSLLRVGLTSELRLEMEERKGGEWRVTNVLG
jgi:hypothetical protein